MKTFSNSTLMIILIVLLGNLFFSACSKDSDDPSTPTSSSNLVSTITYYDENDEIEAEESYQYDEEGRLTEIDYDDGSYDLLEYSGSNITWESYENDELSFSSVLELNNKGLCTSESYDDGSEIDTYEYDSNGYRKSCIYESDSYITTETYIVSGGNYVTINTEDYSNETKSASLKKFDHFKKKSRFLKNMEKRFAPLNNLKSAKTDLTYETNYQFYKSETNTIEYESLGISFLGKSNKNPIKEVTEISSSGDDADNYTTTYTYEYDSEGRIIKQLDDAGYAVEFTYID